MIYKEILDVMIVIGLVIIVYSFLRKTEGFKIALAILVIYGGKYLAGVFKLEYTSDILGMAVNLFALGSVMIFYPEIRMFLKRMTNFKGPVKPTNGVIDVIEDTLFELSSSKTGALIILDESGHIANISENGVFLDAKIENKLLRSIFQIYSPLHDGAVIITNSRIRYAGCKLPLSVKKRPDFESFGTRHMVAVETAENFDCIVFVVSEETGAIRIATKDGFAYIGKRSEFKDFFDKR